VSVDVARDRVADKPDFSCGEDRGDLRADLRTEHCERSGWAVSARSSSVPLRGSSTTCCRVCGVALVAKRDGCGHRCADTSTKH
jgi:hypothetical protein